MQSNLLASFCLAVKLYFLGKMYLEAVVAADIVAGHELSLQLI